MSLPHDTTDRVTFTVVLFASYPKYSVEQFIWRISGLRRTCLECHACEEVYGEANWELGFAVVDKRRQRGGGQPW